MADARTRGTPTAAAAYATAARPARPRQHGLWGTLAAFVRKEVHHILRDRQTLTVLLLMPLVQVLLFGAALRTDIHGVRVAVVDPTPDAETLRLRAALAGSGRFALVAVAPTLRALEPRFRRGETDVAVVLPSGFADRLARGRPAGARNSAAAADGPDVLVVTDASDPNSGSTMQAYVLSAIGDYERDARARAAGATGGVGEPPDAARAGPPRITLATRMRFNPTLESANLFVPGLMALVLTLVSALMTAISLSREKERGTLEILLVSPLRPWQIVVGKVVPYLALGMVISVTVLLSAHLVFHVPLRGSVTLLLAECLLFTLTSLALGVLIAARTGSQRAAMLGALLGTLLPTALLSGMIFPIASMPTALQWVTHAVPARWFLVVVRGIMLKGVGLAYLWRETAVLAGMTLLLMTAAVRSFRARLA
jgi:ABC-2 type transport system permease protein